MVDCKACLKQFGCNQEKNHLLLENGISPISLLEFGAQMTSGFRDQPADTFARFFSRKSFKFGLVMTYISLYSHFFRNVYSNTDLFRRVKAEARERSPKR